MTPEGRVKKAITDLLKAHGAYYHMPVQNGYGKTCLDYHVGHRGFYAAIEAKKPGGEPTKRQIEIMEELMEKKCSVFLIDDTNTSDFALFRAWLETPVVQIYSPLAYFFIIKSRKAKAAQT